MKTTTLLKSAPLAWGAMILIAIVLVLTFRLRPCWWAFIDIFFFFMMAFSHAAACSLVKISPAASRTLDLAALVCGIAAVAALIVEWILYAIML